MVNVVIHGNAVGVGAVQSRAYQARGSGAGFFVYLKTTVLQCLSAHLHGEKDIVRIPDGCLLTVHIGKLGWIPIRNFTDHVAAAVCLAPRNPAKPCLAIDCGLPCLVKRIAKGGGSSVSGNKNFSV